MILFIYLTDLGHSCSTQDFQSSLVARGIFKLQHVRSSTPISY